MSRPGTPIDNPRAESFVKTLKREEIYALEYETLNDLRNRLPRFLDEIYNRRRIHSTLGYLTPEEFEQQLTSAPVNLAVFLFHLRGFTANPGQIKGKSILKGEQR